MNAEQLAQAYINDLAAYYEQPDMGYAPTLNFCPVESKYRKLAAEAGVAWDAVQEAYSDLCHSDESKEPSMAEATWGLYIRWPDGRFVLMERGTEAEVRFMCSHMVDNGTDEDEVRVAPLQ